MADLAASLAKIRHHVSSKLENQKAPAQLLIALEATLAENQPKQDASANTSRHAIPTPPPAEYFLALESMIAKAMEKQASPTLLPSVIYLLSLVSPHVSPAVLKARLGSLLPALSSILSNPHGSLAITSSSAAAQTQAIENHAALLRSAIAVLQALFLSLSYHSSDRATLDRDLRLKGCWNSTLDLCTDSRPKVRRRAQECVAEVLDVVSESGKPHPYAARTSEWAIKALQGVADSGSVSSKGKGSADTKPAFDKKTGKAQQPEVAALLRQQRQASGEAGASSGIWVCGFLRSLAPTMQARYIAPLCTVLLRLPGLHNPFLSVAAFEVFEALFRPSRPAGSVSADALAGTSASSSSKSHATSDTLVQTLQALTSSALIPGPNDVQVVPPYLRALEGAMIAYARLDASEAFSHVPKLWSDVVDLSLSARSKASRDSAQVRAAGRDALQSLVRYCVTDEAIDEACKSGKPIGDVASENDAKAPLRRIIARMAETIGRQALSFNHSIAECLAVLTTIVSRLRHRPQNGAKSAAETLVAPILAIAAELRGQENFEHREQADALLGMAIEVCGPAYVLELLPLGLLGENGPTVGGRAWLLQLLRSRVTNTDLNHFVDSMVPLSEKIFNRRQEAEAAVDPTTGKPTRAVEAKVYEALTEQIWACFPAYCDLALGVPQALSPRFIELLANVLYTQVSLRPSVCRGLQVLVERNQTLAKSASPPEMLRSTFRGLDQEAGKRNVAHLSELAPNLLAVFFNVFSSSPSESRGYVSECLASFLGVTKPQDVRSTFARVGEMLGGALKELVPARDRETGPGSIPPTAHTMLDLLIAMIPFLGLEDSRALFERATADDLLRCDDAGVQKKAYRALARLVSGSPGGASKGDAVLRGDAGKSDGAAGAKVPALLAKLRDATKDLVPGAKRDRIALLAAIVPRIPSDSMHLLPQIIPEAVLATKEANQGSRELAYELLVQMGRKMEAGGRVDRALANAAGDDDADMAAAEGAEASASSTEASVSEYLTMVAAGLAGTTPHMISATITSLARLLFEFKSSLPRPTLDELLATLDVFLASSNREIIKSCLGFVKVAIVGLPVEVVDPHLPGMIKTILGWPSEHRQHFKSKVRHIFERLIRRFGYERVESLTDEENKKLIRNIQKRKERARRKKGSAEDGGEEDEEAGEGGVQQGQRVLKKVGVDAFEEAIYGSESEISDDEDDEVQNSDRRGGAGAQKGRAATGAAAAASSRKIAGARRQRGGAGEGAEEETYIVQDDDSPMDLLDRAAVAGGGIQTRPSSGSKGGGAGGKRMTAAQSMEAAKARRAAAGDRFRTDEATGRMIVNASDDEGGDEGGGQGFADAADVDVEGAGRAYMDRERGTGGLDLSGSKVRANKNNKRTRAEDVEMDLEQMRIEEAAAVAAAAVEGKAPQQDKKKKMRREKETIGGEFRSKKGRGDVAKGGKDPYAYVPLAKVGGKKGRQGAAGSNIAFKGKKGRN